MAVWYYVSIVRRAQLVAYKSVENLPALSGGGVTGRAQPFSRHLLSGLLQEHFRVRDGDRLCGPLDR